MADDVSESIENALNIIVSTAERSGNMIKGLKQTIFETVSTLRNLFVKLKDSRAGKCNTIIESATTVRQSGPVRQLGHVGGRSLHRYVI